MSLLDRLEKRFGGAAMPGATVWILAGQAMVFLGQYLSPMANAGGGGAAIFEALALDPAKVLGGEWWRLFSFPFLAPLGQFPLFVILYFWFFYFIGTTLEGVWGAFRYNAYLALGYLATVAATFITHAFVPGGMGLVVGDYLYGTLFLAFARLFPDFEMLLMFILPVKIRWLALLQWIGYWFVFFFGDWHARLMVLAAVFNFIVFFGSDILRDMRYGHRRMQHKARTLKTPERISHQCRVCGLSSVEAPRTSFRYCSQCVGQCCYCPDHLRDHEHVVDERLEARG